MITHASCARSTTPGMRRALPVLTRLITLHRSRKALAHLDADQLADVGLTARDACREARRPVWDVPATWRD